MKKFKDYFHLWAPAAKPALKKFANITVQTDVAIEPPRNKDLRSWIVVTKDANPQTLLRLLGQGYCHIIQEDREDFAFSMLSAAVLISQPLSFFKSPMDLVFRSPTDPSKVAPTESIDETWTAATNVAQRIDAVMDFILKVPKTRPFQGHFHLILEEMSSNAIKDAKQDKEKGCRTLISANSEKVAFVLFDKMDSFPETRIRDRLTQLSRMRRLQVSASKAGGAGIGIPFMIEYSTDFYLVHIHGAGGVTACVVDLRKGLKTHEMRSKNVHLLNHSN